MIRKSLPNPTFFNTGITLIEHGPSETQEEFNATKDQATYQFGGKTHILQLDGKIDEVVERELPGREDFWIKDLRQLRGRASSIISACKASEEPGSELSQVSVDLGTQVKWIASPDYNRERELTGHTLHASSSSGRHSISVEMKEEGVVLTVNSEARESGLGHSMSGLFLSNGEIIPRHEGVSWRGE